MASTSSIGREKIYVFAPRQYERSDHEVKVWRGKYLAVGGAISEAVVDATAIALQTRLEEPASLVGRAAREAVGDPLAGGQLDDRCIGQGVVVAPEVEEKTVHARRIVEVGEDFTK